MTKDFLKVYPSGYINVVRHSYGSTGAFHYKRRKESSEKVSIESLYRSKRAIKDLIIANSDLKPFFLTLTFAKAEKDFDSYFYQWKKFKQRLEYLIGGKLKYILVYEFQKRGVLHYHIVLFDFPFVSQKKLQDLWGLGIVDIRQVRNFRQLSFYITKYILKNFSSDKATNFALNRKRYFFSKNLKRVYRVTEKTSVAISIDEIYGDDTCRLVKSFVSKDKGYYYFSELFFSKSLAQKIVDNYKDFLLSFEKGLRRVLCKTQEKKNKEEKCIKTFCQDKFI